MSLLPMGREVLVPWKTLEQALGIAYRSVALITPEITFLLAEEVLFANKTSLRGV